MRGAADTSERPARVSRLDSAGAALWILGLATLIVLIPARGYLTPFTPLGDDASSHIATIATLARALETGAGWWSNDYNGGFPLGLYYQPLPHVVSAAVCALVGGHAAAAGVFKALMIAMLAIQPWAVFVGMRRAGFERLESAIAGFFAPLIIDGIQFGYHAQASLNIGLYTQAWGNVMLPLAFGELAAIGRGDGRLGRAIAACCLVATTHMFYAIALVVPGLLYAVLGRAWRRSAWQLPATGIGAFVVLAPWLVPLTLTQAFFGGWPFGRPSRVHGHGWTELLALASGGQLMDGDNTPVLGALAVLGVALLAGALVIDRSRARRKAAVFALVLVAWAAFGAAGRAGLEEIRPGLGPLIDILNPLHENVQLFRYGAVLQFALLMPIGFGLAVIARALEKHTHAVVAIVALGAAAVLPLKAGVAQLERGFRTIDEAGNFHPEPYAHVAEFLRRDDAGGRMYITKRSGLRGHYHSGLMTWMADRPAAQSYGVGLHDSLHFYTLEYLHPDDAGADALADLFDFRTVVHSPGADLSGFGRLERTYRSRHYAVSRFDGNSGQAVEPMREARTMTGTPRGVRREIRAWLRGNGPRSRQTVVLEVDDPRSREHLLGHPGAPDRAMTFEAAPGVGETLESKHEADRFMARVRMDEPGLIVAKIGYHPFWRVTLDGDEVETVFAFPGFVAVRANAGEHEVSGRFRWPAYSRGLLLLSPWPLLFGGWLQRRLGGRRGAGPASDAAAADAHDEADDT